MNDLISREGLIKEVCGKCDGACDCCCEENCIRCKRPNMRCDFRKALDDVPTVDAVPVVHGRWRYYSTTMQECSECQRHTARHKFKYCPHCGSFMEDKNNDG